MTHSSKKRKRDQNKANKTNLTPEEKRQGSIVLTDEVDDQYYTPEAQRVLQVSDNEHSPPVLELLAAVASTSLVSIEDTNRLISEANSVLNDSSIVSVTSSGINMSATNTAPSSTNSIMSTGGTPQSNGNPNDPLQPTITPTGPIDSNGATASGNELSGGLTVGERLILDTLRTMKAEFHAKTTGLETSINGIQVKLDQMESAHKAEMDGVKTAIAKTATDVAKVSTLANKLDDKMKTMERKIKDAVKVGDIDGKVNTAIDNKNFLTKPEFNAKVNDTVTTAINEKNLLSKPEFENQIDAKVNTAIDNKHILTKPDFDYDTTVVFSGVQYENGEDAMAKASKLFIEGLKITDVDVVRAKRVPVSGRDTRPGLFKVEVATLDEKKKVLASASELKNYTTLGRSVQLRSSQTYELRTMSKNMRVLLDIVGKKEDYRVTRNGLLVPKTTQ